MNRRHNQALQMVSATLLLVASMARADTSEEYFKGALEYTVQIKTTVSVPFDGESKRSSMGAGFLVDAERGWVMTNAHVVSRSPSQVVLAFNGQEFSEATKVYVDPFLDLALIKVSDSINTRGVSPAQLDCGSLPSVGHPVGAFGHPWRLRFTGTRGIISGATAKYLTEMLQTDAPINSGNSGGPLMSLVNGKIVGINTSSIRGGQNTNFALAMKYACRILRLLQDGQDPSPPDLGLVYFKDVDERNALKVARSYPTTGAQKLMPGDVINRVEGETSPIENETQLLHALRGRFAKSSITVLRNNQELTIHVDKTPMPSVIARRGVYASGLLFGSVTYKDADEIRMRGFMVHHVEPSTVGHAQEITESDLLETIDGETPEDVDQLFKRMSDAQSEGRSVRLTFKRISDHNRAVFSYFERNLKIGDLRIIGPQGHN